MYYDSKNKEVFEIAKGIEIVDISLNIKDYIVISDLHLGYEQALNKEGFMIPKFQFKKITDKLIEIFEITKPKKIVINGDLKHDFGRITKQESDEVKKLIEFLESYLNEIIIIKGNHDNLTEFILKKHDVTIEEKFTVENNIFTHGHKLIKDLDSFQQSNIIIGHEHPCIGIRNGERVEKVKCFLKGDLGFVENKNLIVMPSFNFLTEGSDILQETILSPYLKKSNIKEYEIFAVENFKVFPFGKYDELLKANQNFI